MKVLPAKPPVGGPGKVANNNPINGIRTSVAKSRVFPHAEEARERAGRETVCAKGIQGVGVDSEDGQSHSCVPQGSSVQCHVSASPMSRSWLVRGAECLSYLPSSG